VVFQSLGCLSCHGGPALTDSTLGAATLHDVGTLRTTSGQRLGGPLDGIDTPSLLGIWTTAPYFHDGSAATLDDVFRVAGGVVLPAEGATVSGGAQVVSQWVELNNDDTVRGRAYAALQGAGSRITFSGVDGGPGGTGAIEIRYSLGWPRTMELAVNGSSQSLDPPLVGNDPGWRHVNWGTLRVEGVTLAAGAANTIELSVPGGGAEISVDEIAVSTAADLAAAQPHRAALGLSAADYADLTAFLLELDGSEAGVADPTIFSDGFESGNTSAWAAG
jgi:hypothetical protein